MNFAPSRRTAIGASAAALALAFTPRNSKAQTAQAIGLERDRQSVLAMSGTFHARFDTRETVPFVPDYEPLEPSISAGNEVVRVIEDAGSTIRLQHILVVSRGDVSRGDADIVVRHWRQDWHYEPRDVLIYTGADTWRLERVADAERRGKWAQIVYNTDDSPRYGALGVWRHDYGVSRWTSARGLRPLARRDAVREPPYSHYSCVNRPTEAREPDVMPSSLRRVGINFVGGFRHLVPPSVTRIKFEDLARLKNALNSMEHQKRFELLPPDACWPPVQHAS